MVCNNIHNESFSKVRLQYWICLLLVIMTLSVYWQVKDYGFVSYDDPLYVSDNRYVQKGLTVETIIWSFTDASKITNYWVPVTWLSILMDYELYGLNAGGYHLTNVLFHILNTVLLFIFFRRTTGALWQSAFAAALFALHPLHVESVVWVTERKDVLSAFFWLLTLLSYGEYVRRSGLWRYLLTLFLFILGMMAKPMLVTLPFVLLLLDYWPLGRMQAGSVLLKPPRQALVWKLICEKAPFFVVIVIAGVATFLTQQAGGAVKPLASVPFDARIANMLVSYLSYIGKMFWPTQLAFLYPHPGALPLWQWAGALLILGVITYLVFRFATVRPYLAVGWLWYLGTLVPVIGLVVIGPHVMADRYTYVPLIGLYMMIAWGVPEAVTRWRYKMQGLSITAVVMLLLLAGVTWAQVRYWQNSISLFEHAIEVTENNYIAYNNLGAVFQEKGMAAEAMNLYLKALKIKPDHIETHLNLGILFKRMGRIDEALNHFYKALEINPGFKGVHFSLGLALTEQGKIESAIWHYLKALQIDPNYAKAHNNLGIIMEGQGKIAEAIKHYLKAVQIDFEHKEAHSNLGKIFLTQGKINLAANHYLDALKIDPFYAEAHNSLGVVLARQGRTAEAIVHFRKAKEIAPGYVDAQKNLKTMLTIQAEMDRAILKLREAIAHNPDDAVAHYELGQMYKSRGELENAAIHYREALWIDPAFFESSKNLAIISAMQGHYDTARSILKESIAVRPDQWQAYYYIAGTYARQKKIEEAVQWLKQAVEKGFDNWDLLKTDQNLERIRTTSYYKELLRNR